MKKVKEKYVGFEVAKLAKEKKFPQTFQYKYYVDFVEELEQRIEVYQSHDRFDVNVDKYAMPPQSLLRDWIEANSDMVLNVVPFGFCVLESFECDDTWSCSIHDKKRDKYHQWVSGNCDFTTRHEALEDCLLNALKRMG